MQVGFSRLGYVAIFASASTRGCLDVFEAAQLSTVNSTGVLDDDVAHPDLFSSNCVGLTCARTGN